MMKMKDNILFTLNPDRIKYLMEKFGLTKEELIKSVNGDRTRNLLTLDNLDGKNGISESILKRIDSVFQQGLTWYITKRDLPEKSSSSIFFRKKKFNSDLNLESRKLVSKYERLKFEIKTLSNFIDFNCTKKTKDYQVEYNPKKAAKENAVKFSEIKNDLISNNILKKENKNDDRLFLKNLIRIIEEFNIFVFEFTETWNKKEKATFDGFFISPNVIVLKRQKYYRREIFTLMHEFAHCLLNSEEIDVLEEPSNIDNSDNIEKWCHTFAFYFLLNDHIDEFAQLGQANSKNNYLEQEIKQLYEKTFISHTAFYTRLRIENKLSKQDYDIIKKEIERNVQKREQEEKHRRELEKLVLKEQGKKPAGFAPKPIESNLFKEILRINYFQGSIDESRLREHLRIKENQSIDEVLL